MKKEEKLKNKILKLQKENYFLKQHIEELEEELGYEYLLEDKIIFQNLQLHKKIIEIQNIINKPIKNYDPNI